LNWPKNAFGFKENAFFKKGIGSLLQSKLSSKQIAHHGNLTSSKNLMVLFCDVIISYNI